MKIGGVDGFLPYRATATLLASALSDPPSLEEISALRTPDLDKFLPPRRKGVSPASQRRRIELDFVYSPIIDLGVPSDDKCVLIPGNGQHCILTLQHMCQLQMLPLFKSSVTVYHAAFLPQQILDQCSL